MQFSKEAKSNSIIRLQFYNESPKGQLQLQELENLAIERLKVLKVVETVNQDLVKGSKEYIAHLKEQLEKCGELGKILTQRASSFTASEQPKLDIRDDVISHFVLRIAYCHSEQLRKWFVTQEVDLFKWRFESADRNTMTRFLQDNNIHFESVDDKEKMAMAKVLKATLNATVANNFDNMGYFKVPFTEVLDLVRTRRVVLRGGMAFVPENDLTSLVAARFRAHLSHALSITSRALPYLEEDTRLLPILSSLSKRYLGEEFGNKENSGDTVTADQVDGLAKLHFPPCMQQLHQSLRRDSHLRHGGRMQYGLFLKGIGLPMEESLKFWKNAFRKKVEPEQFDKRFSYNIRHSYGREGKRTSYTPYSCIKIIIGNQPGTGDFHGCPFRHSDPSILRQRLQSVPQSSSEKVEGIVGKAKDRQYQLACRDNFKMIHNLEGIVDVAINHPNQFYEESQKVARALESGRIVNENRSGATVVKVRAVDGSRASAVNNSMDESMWEEMEEDDLSLINLSTTGDE